MKKDISFSVFVMLESISYIKDHIKGLDWEEFTRSVMVQDAVLRRITVIGEATKSIPGDVRSRYPEVPWKDIAGMRDKLVHAYLGVILERVWEVCTENLPSLEERLKVILAELEEEERSLSV
jgi:uncharacterized protein with HEPN domain